MTKLVIMLSSIYDKTGNTQQMTKLVIMLSSVDDETGKNATFS